MINQAWRKTKATGQGGPKCHLASTWGEKKGEEKEKGNLEFTRGKFSFFSWTAERLIMGLDLTSVPLGMWSRALVVMGRRVFRGRCGLGSEVYGWASVRGGVPLGDGRMGQGGSIQEGLAGCPGWGWRGAQHRGPHGPLPTVQLLHILNSWHIMGIQALVVLR